MAISVLTNDFQLSQQIRTFAPAISTSAWQLWPIKCLSSICVKDQLTILRLGPIKYLSERSVEKASALAYQVFV